MKISIALATYNGERYLQAQLDSFLCQSRRPDEVVITDDCSTDGTALIINSFLESAPFKVIFKRNKENIGICQNFSNALALTSGDLVFLSDQDDIWFSNKIEKVEKIASKNSNYCVFMNDQEIVDQELKSSGVRKIHQIRSAGLTDSKYVAGCAVAVRQSFLKSILPIPVGYEAHDAWIVNLAVGVGRRMLIDEVLQLYRRHESADSGWIINSRHKVTKIDFFKYYIKKLLLSPPTVSRLKNILIIREIFKDKVFELSIESENRELRTDFLFFFEKLQFKNKSFEKRIELLSKSRIKRIPMIVKHLISGGYAPFYGLKSAIRDIISP